MERRRSEGDGKVVVEKKRKLKPGDVVNGTYEVDRFLGSGYSAEVWEVRHRFLPASFALKLMHEEDIESEHKTSRFSAEASTLFRLHHPNIVRVHEANRTPEGLPFTVMDLLEGETLTQKLARGPIHPLRALKLTYDAACGLDEAHENGVIHRDVKPDNIFVTTRWVAVLLDFAAAKFLKEGLRTTKPPDRVGTLAYMAPEQIDGTADARGDQYALAMVLRRMLAGKHPYESSLGVQHQHKLMKDQFETIPPPFAEAAGLPPWIDDVVARALEKPVDLRYPTMAAFAQAIHESMRRLAVEIREGRVVVDVPLGEPPIDLDGDGATGSRRSYVAPEQPARQTTGPVIPSQRITLAPGALSSSGEDASFDAAVTAPLSRAPAIRAPSTTAPRSTSAAPVMTTLKIRRPPRSLAWFARLALMLAVPTAAALAWRWTARHASLEVSVRAVPAAPASPAAPSADPPSAAATAEPAATPTSEPAAPAQPARAASTSAAPSPPKVAALPRLSPRATAAPVVALPPTVAPAPAPTPTRGRPIFGVEGDDRP